MLCGLCESAPKKPYKSRNGYCKKHQPKVGKDHPDYDGDEGCCSDECLDCCCTINPCSEHGCCADDRALGCINCINPRFACAENGWCSFCGNILNCCFKATLKPMIKATCMACNPAVAGLYMFDFVCEFNCFNLKGCCGPKSWLGCINCINPRFACAGKFTGSAYQRDNPGCLAFMNPFLMDGCCRDEGCLGCINCINPVFACGPGGCLSCLNPCKNCCCGPSTPSVKCLDPSCKNHTLPKKPRKKKKDEEEDDNGSGGALGGALSAVGVSATLASMPVTEQPEAEGEAVSD